MDLAAAILFLVLYFIRPHDWIPGLSGLNIMRPVMAFGFFALMSRREGILPNGWRSLFRSPVDWAVYSYAAWILITTPGLVDTFSEIFSLVSFYFLTTQALTSHERTRIYLKWWFGCLIAISLLALGSLVGIDITQAKEITEFNKGRLCLNTWMLDNPNALGHTVIVGLPLAYFLLFWKGNIFNRTMAFVWGAVCFFCVFKTESKGAALSGFIAFCGSWLFGRPKIVQILAGGVMFLMSGTALSLMPRMNEMSSLQTDEAVLGRVMAWELARTSFRNNPNGVGYRKFVSYITYQQQVIRKPPHSSYIQIAADLGAPGLFIYLLIIVAAIFVLIRLKGTSELAERNRRIWFALLLAFICSSWVVQRPYHTEFFLIMGGISSYFVIEAARRQEARNAALAAALEAESRALDEAALAEERTPETAKPARRPRRRIQWLSPAFVQGREQLGRLLPLRPGWREFAFAAIYYSAVIAVWDYVLEHF